jgi:hypothetical protein
MKYLLICIFIALLFLSCNVPKEPPYQFVKDNLYIDQKGDLFIKSIDRSAADSGDPELDAQNTHIRWLNVVYCEPCTLKTGDEEVPGLAYLTDKIDTATFRHVSVDNEQGGDLYEDKNHHYYHKWMADGGTISLWSKNSN